MKQAHHDSMQWQFRIIRRCVSGTMWCSGSDEKSRFRPSSCFGHTATPQRTPLPSTHLPSPWQSLSLEQHMLVFPQSGWWLHPPVFGTFAGPGP